MIVFAFVVLAVAAGVFGLGWAAGEWWASTHLVVTGLDDPDGGWVVLDDLLGGRPAPVPLRVVPSRAGPYDWAVDDPTP